MAYTALQVVNKILKRAQRIQGSSEELTTFTSSSIQHDIDVSLEYLNMMIHELFRLANLPLPTQAATQDITMALDTREYTFSPADVEKINWPLIDETNGQYIWEYRGGFDQMRKDQTQPSSYTGLPNFAAVNPVNGNLRVDRAPEAADVGKVYTMYYSKRVSIAAIADTFPFNDTVADSLIDAVVEVFELKESNDFKSFMATSGFSRAAFYLNPNSPSDEY